MKKKNECLNAVHSKVSRLCLIGPYLSIHMPPHQVQKKRKTKMRVNDKKRQNKNNFYDSETNRPNGMQPLKCFQIVYPSVYFSCLDVRGHHVHARICFLDNIEQDRIPSC